MPVTSVYESDDYEVNLRAAERCHDEQARSLAAMRGMAARRGGEALRAVAIVSGGSAAAMLAFICWLIANRHVELASWLPWSLRAFVIGLLCACAGMGMAYFAQSLHVEAMKRQARIWIYPYVENAPGSVSRRRFGTLFDLVKIGLAIAAYVALIVGYLAAYRAISMVGFS